MYNSYRDRSRKKYCTYKYIFFFSFGNMLNSISTVSLWLCKCFEYMTVCTLVLTWVKTTQRIFVIPRQQHHATITYNMHVSCHLRGSVHALHVWLCVRMWAQVLSCFCPWHLTQWDPPYGKRCFCWQEHIQGNGSTLLSQSRALKQNWALSP